MSTAETGGGDLLPIEDERPWSITKTGLSLSGQLSFDEAREMLETMAAIDRAFKFALGDGLIYVAQQFGHRASELFNETHFSAGTLNNVMYVCRNVPVENRDFDLSFAHYYEVAKFDPEQQLEWLTLAAKNKWTREVLRYHTLGRHLEDPYENGRFVMPVNDLSAIQTVLAWLRGSYVISKDELLALLEKYLKERDDDQSTRA